MHRAIRGRSRSHNINYHPHHHLCHHGMSILMCFFSRHNNLTGSSPNVSLSHHFRVLYRNSSSSINIHKSQLSLASLDSPFSPFSLYNSNLVSLQFP